jgi:biopolymer transport protein ExbD
MIKRGFFLVAVLSVLAIFIFTSVFSQDAKNFQVKKQPEIQQVKPKKPVRIKIRRSAEDKYTWEITGDDADEIVRADRRLRKLLKIE